MPSLHDLHLKNKQQEKTGLAHCDLSHLSKQQEGSKLNNSKDSHYFHHCHFSVKKTKQNPQTNQPTKKTILLNFENLCTPAQEVSNLSPFYFERCVERGSGFLKFLKDCFRYLFELHTCDYLVIKRTRSINVNLDRWSEPVQVFYGSHVLIVYTGAILQKLNLPGKHTSHSLQGVRPVCFLRLSLVPDIQS